jgi:hypothetical protein
MTARAEPGARRDHMVAGLGQTHQRGGDRGHAGRARPRGRPARQRRQALLDHGDGRMGDERTDDILNSASDATVVLRTEFIYENQSDTRDEKNLPCLWVLMVEICFFGSSARWIVSTGKF